ncbi:MAG: 16S rRNA (cytosine(1402)-N(4))-methyltransferase RsmH [Opitutales bacterium]
MSGCPHTLPLALAARLAMTTPGGHQPVMLAEVLQALAPAAGSCFLDGTFGGGGHTRALLDAAEGVRVTALDCDPAAKNRATYLQNEYAGRFRFVDLNFGEAATLDENGFDGVLLDLGVSSFQLDEGARGFSFREDAPADMRLDPRTGQPASDFLEHAPTAALIEAVRDWGEERRWRAVVRAIEAARGTGLLSRTASLAELVATAVLDGGRQSPGAPGRRLKIHPATRTFQGLRIAVNDELRVLERALPALFAKLRPGGVLAVISFHSLEDRIVKRWFRRFAGRPEHRSDERTQDERQVQADLLTPRPLRPTDDEVAVNPRSRSARLRAVRRLPLDP